MENSLKTLLRKHNVSLKKAYGQNFLTDSALLDEIVEKAGVESCDTVLEIGCGAGALTRAIAKKAKRVIGYEIDTSLKPVLSDVLSEYKNVEIIFGDIMKQKMADVEKKLGGKYIMVANLPYYITTPIIMQFIENAKNLSAMVIMVQEEVAYRLASKESTSDYGAITVGINLRGEAQVVLKVGREKFSPPPNVDSAVVKIVINHDKFKSVDMTAVRNIVRIAFSSRRKMLINNIMNGFKLSREVVEKLLTDSNISLTARGENLTAKDYVCLCETMKKAGVIQ